MTKSNIQGIIPPMVTPFDADGRIDEAAHRAEVRYLIEEARVQGVCVCGSTGEGHTLTTEETRQITAWTVEEARGRVPVITGVIVDSTQAAIERGRAVADLGVAALQVTPVHYLFRPDDDGMLRYFESIVQRSGLPVVLYNVVPWSYLLPPLLLRILRDVDGVVGVKQSASDMKTLADLMLLLEDAGIRDSVSILSAQDALLYPSFVLGVHGSIAAILTAAPKHCVALWDAVQAGNYERALELHKGLLRLWNTFDVVSLPAAIKTTMRLQGRNSGVPRAPLAASSAAQSDKINEAIRFLPRLDDRQHCVSRGESHPARVSQEMS